jgi:5-bromo-4-chloroindolyl phosphate hydrolysis protein
MRVIVFVSIIIASALFFGLFTILDEGFIHDTTLEFTYESVILTITIGAIGIGAAKYYGDETANTTIREIKKNLSDLNQRLDRIESELKNNRKE